MKHGAVRIALAEVKAQATARTAAVSVEMVERIIGNPLTFMFN